MFNAYWEPLDFELPVLGAGADPWCRWIDTALDPPNDICDWKSIMISVWSFGDSKAILRFTAPPEVKGVALLVVNHADRASDQWMWIPAEERDRRIALQDRSTRFFGTDFSFEDLEERDVNQFDYKLLGDEAIGGESCWKIESQPKPSKPSQYTSSTMWVRKDNYVLARIDNFNKDKLIRRILYTDAENISGIWTPRTVEVFDITKDSRTVLKLDKVEYNVPLKDEAFTRDALR